MEITLSGMVMLVTSEPQNALAPIEVTLLPMATSLRLEHELNAYSPIEVTLLPMATSLRLEQ